MAGPDPNDPHPMRGFPQVCYIRNTVTNPQIEIGCPWAKNSLPSEQQDEHHP